MKRVKRPLEKGSKISFMGTVATVVADHGAKVDVVSDGVPQVWDWYFAGIECELAGGVSPQNFQTPIDKPGIF